MNILVLSQGVPKAPEYSGCPRVFELFKQIAKEHKVVLCCMNTSLKEFQEKQSSLAPYYKHIYCMDVSEGKSPNRYKRWVNLLKFKPYFYEKNLKQEKYYGVRSRIQVLCAEHQIDSIFADTLYNAQYLDGLGIPFVVDGPDAISLLASRMVANAKGIKRRIGLLIEAFLILLYERYYIKHARSYVVNSPIDQNFLLKWGGKNVYVIENGVDTEYFSFIDREELGDNNTIIFTGTMSYSPNDDAAHYFVKMILPHIKTQIDSVKVFIVGADPSESVLALAEQDGVEVTGYVDDIRKYYRMADVFVCPLRYGTGMKNKILNSFAMGVPVVGTTISFDGIDVTNGVDCVSEDNPKLFADRVVEILRDKALAMKMGQAGRQLVESKYDWAAISKRLSLLMWSSPDEL